MDRATAEKRLGDVLGRYTLSSVLGVGGMATVYEANHRDGHKVALKLLHPHFATREDVRAPFVREAYAANTIEHPGVVRVVDADVAPDGSAFMVMELLDGETLEAWQDREGPKLRPEEVFVVVHEVLDVLVHAHWHGVVHRDLKPDNLFRTTEGRIKVLDFGIARLMHETGLATKTRTGNLLGTPAFMPPEQAQGRADQIDGRTDLWALGATAFALLSGQYVHAAKSVALLNIASGSQPARAITPLVPELHADLADVVDTALRFEKVDRWHSARAMQEALEVAFEKAFGRSLANPQQVALRASLRGEPSGLPGADEAPSLPLEVAPPPAWPTLSQAARSSACSTDAGVVSGSGPSGPEPTRRGWLAIAVVAVAGMVALGSSRFAHEDLEGEGPEAPPVSSASSAFEPAPSPEASAPIPAVPPSFEAGAAPLPQATSPDTAVGPGPKSPLP